MAQYLSLQKLDFRKPAFMDTFVIKTAQLSYSANTLYFSEYKTRSTSLWVPMF